MNDAGAPGEPPPIDKDLILVGIDFSPWSLEALSAARSLAAERSADLLVLHVIDVPNVTELASIAGVADPAFREQLETSRRRMLAETVLSVLSGAEPAATEVVAWGRPYEQILRKGIEFAADLIVLGIAGRAADMERALFGSTAERVLRGAPCPVLCIPG
ncbi:MAG TPA: universal stress protein [Candidatus Polarisedimenticolia bacterium]|nr:universal stress protein [Candidatus Polarisedimenticolia bacterium]